MESNLVLEMKNISKSFPGVKALKDVNFSCKKGSVHALVGENGAGKSTLLKILSGELEADSGSIFIDGKSVHFKNPRDAQKLGIAMVHQELKLLPELSIGQNMFLNNEPRNFLRFIDKKKIYDDTKKMMDEYDMHLDPDDLVKDLSIAQKQMVEILKLLSASPEIIILDEPTSSLAQEEVEKLYSIIRRLTKGGKTVIFISHRLEEIFHICSEATVFKDGNFVKDVNIAEIDQDELIRLMVGRPLISLFPPKAKDVSSNANFEVSNLSLAGKLKDISFSIKKNEVLGIAGLEGHGQTELLNCIAGVDARDSGKIFIQSKEVFAHSPIQAINEGIVLVPEDRKTQGLFLPLSVRENLAASSLNLRSILGFMRKNKEIDFAKEFIKKLSIKAYNSDIQVGTLSGGNQQKVVLGKGLAVNPKVLLFNEPTRGIDVETKAEFYKLIRGLSSEGLTVILYSSDLVELCGISDKVVVMYEGKVSAIIESKDISEENIMRAATGIKDTGGLI